MVPMIPKVPVVPLVPWVPLVPGVPWTSGSSVLIYGIYIQTQGMKGAQPNQGIVIVQEPSYSRKPAAGSYWTCTQE